MTVAEVARQNTAREIATFDRLSAEGTHAGLSAREFAQFFRHIGLLDLDRTSSIVDLGCGDGLLTCEVARLGFTNVTGVDISPGAIARANRRAEEQELDIDFRIGDIADMRSIEPGNCDVAIVSGVLHHFPTTKAKRSVVTEARRILRPGGLFVGIEPNRWNPYWYLPMVMMKLTWSRLPISFSYVKCHCTENEQNQLSPGELKRIFMQLGIRAFLFEPFEYVKPKPQEKRYHRGAAALYRDVMERSFSKILPKPHNASYFVFRARMTE